MDFGTVRKKLSSDAYVNLEQFEKDVFLICSNAMQYNAPDTIYFRQARSIQELAKKNFENLRQDSDDNEPEPKVVRRGRPPMKNFKKSVGRPPSERAGSEFSSDATLAAGGENTIMSTNDLRKGSCLADRSGLADLQFHGSRNEENKLEKNDESAGSPFKAVSMKHVKKQIPLDENRRNTYKQFHASAGGREPSILSTFDAERKQLMAVGLLSEHGYARSLARFAANIGPVAWRIASRKIERALPQGIRYGPGWVGENDIPPQRPLLPSSTPLGNTSSSRLFSLPDNLDPIVPLQTAESKEENLPEEPEGDNLSEKQIPSICSHYGGHLNSPSLSSASTSTCNLGTIKSEPPKDRAESVKGLNSHTGYYVLDSSVGVIRPRPSLQMRQSPLVHHASNGFNGTYGFNLPAQTGGRVVGSSKLAGTNFTSSQVIGTVSTSDTGFIHMHPTTANGLNLEASELRENPSTMTSSGPLPNSRSQRMEAPRPEIEQRLSWQGLPTQSKSDLGLPLLQKSDSVSKLLPLQKSDTVPPDLNIRFHSPGSPSSTRVDSVQPDLALQL
uniref:Bromo domain-containing protein n=1 Tax=Rhizophora mucronata TaxID=61149 RepID=A0A2P2LHN8_RHIMU